MEVEEITRKIEEYLICPKPRQLGRNYTIRTGVGGFDIFTEAIEDSAGFQRVKMGKKVLRILRILKTPIRKSPVGYYYKLIKNGQVF